ncbi:MAG: tetratricopeptide repeat protein [Chloroflexota bacterium]|nr:MAG: tetratricopeptide repeat protein [Chloroflexota bacterium]
MPTSTPLRLLVITSRPLVDSNNRRINLLDVAQERARVRDALQNSHIAVDVQFVPEGTAHSIKTALRVPRDIIHITCHGTPDGHLVIENNVGEAHLLSKQDTARLFAENTALLVFISACYSEIIANDLHAAGVPTLVAIDSQRPIEDRAAILFAEQFYDGLARAWTFEHAFKDAQHAVTIHPEVGDRNPPLDEEGKPEKPWSQRFILIGDGNTTLHATIGDYDEHGTTERVAGNLRERNRNFVGRAQEIVQIVKAFDARGMQANARRVALHGAGGLGKTELAQAVAWWYAERGRVGAVVWASASPTEDEFVLRDLASLLAIAARALKLNFSEKMPFDEQKALVRDALGAQETLLLLDNWETLVNTEKARGVWNFVLNLPPSVRVLVTSRDKLPPKDAENVELETLAPDDAAQLFLNIARRADYFKNNPQLSGQEASALGAIIERLGGYALAIEVVAGQTESRTLGAIWRDLVQIPKNVLEGKTEFGEPRGVWTSLDFSYNVLPDAEKEMFRGMGIFLAPATVDDIAAILQPVIASPEGAKQSPSETGIASSPSVLLTMTRATLDTLVKRSLVRFREGHYALLPIVRDYAESCLADAGQDPRELHIRAVNYFANKGTLEAKLTASDHLYQLAARFQSEQAAQVFIEYVWSFYDDLVTRGYWAEARRKTEELILVARALDDKVTEAQAMVELGNMYHRIGEYRHASALYEQAQELSSKAGDKRGIAQTLHQMGMVAQAQGNYPEALRLYGESMQLEQELGNKSGIATTLHQMGMVAQAQGNYPEALRLYGESMQLKQELGDKRGIASTLGQMGNMAYSQGNYPEALRLYGDAIATFQELGDKSGIASTLGQMGKLAQQQGELKDALGYYLNSFVLFLELQSPYLRTVARWTQELRAQAGQEQFDAWLAEFVSDEASRRALVEILDSVV